MKTILTLTATTLLSVTAWCQDITGLWQGTIRNDSTAQMLDYEVVISSQHGKFTAYTRTWFLVNDTNYYGVKKINIRVANDGKIIMQDEKLHESNYPPGFPTQVLQLNVLDLVTKGEDLVLSGVFETKRTKAFSPLTGSVHLKRIVASVSQNNPLQYFYNSKSRAEFTAAK